MIVDTPVAVPAHTRAQQRRSQQVPGELLQGWDPHATVKLLNVQEQFNVGEEGDLAKDYFMNLGVVICKHGTQDVCTMNKVRKYHSMCKTLVSICCCWDAIEDISLSIKIFY
jgi:hypothetical protein